MENSGNEKTAEEKFEVTPPPFYSNNSWNSRYCPYQSPYPAVKPGAWRLDLTGTPPGRWCYRVDVKGSEDSHIKISKMYYEKDRPTGAIVRTLGGKGKVKELLSESCTLPMNEYIRLFRVLAEVIEEDGVDVEALLKKPVGQKEV